MTAKIIGFLISIILTTSSYGQYILNTPDGKKVKLNENGTWEYLSTNTPIKKSSSIPGSSTAKYVSRTKKYEIWYDPTQWLCDTTKKGNEYTWDAMFYSTDYAIMGYCLDSRLSMPVENLEATMRQQWQSLGDIKSFTSFKDTINTLPVTRFEMQLENGGVTYQYKGYIHSTIRGSFQFTVGTQKEIFEEDRNKIDLLLKGVTKF